MANETLRFPLLLVSRWRAHTPGRKCPSFGVEEVVLFRFNKMLNWQKKTFFFSGGGGGGIIKELCLGHQNG